MSITNRCTLVGRLGKNIEIHTFEDQKIKGSVTLATNDYYTNANGDKVELVQWHNLIVHGKVAEIFRNYTSKGKQVMVEGKITYREYEDKQGLKKQITEIHVSEVLLLGGSDKNEG